MNKAQAIEILNAKLERTDFDEWVVELIQKFETLPEESYASCQDFYDLRVTIQTYRKPSARKTLTKRKTTYLELGVPISTATEKAIGFVTGTNNKHGSNYREFVQWVAKSQIIEQDDKTFIPAWIVSNEMIWHCVDKNSTITQ